MTRPLLSSAAAVALVALPAAAPALTADEVWASWQERAAGAGVALTAGSEAKSGGTLTLSGLALAADIDDVEDVTITATMSEVSMVEDGAGGVEVMLPPSIPVTIAGSDEEGADGSALITIALSGMSLLLSDADGGGVTNTYAADGITISLDELTEGGEVNTDVVFAISAETLAGRFSSTGGDQPLIESSYNLDSLGLEIAATDPDEGGTFEMTLDMADLASDTTGSFDVADLVAMSPDTTLRDMLDDGFSVDGTGGVGATNYAISAEGMPESFTSSGSISGISGEVVMNAERLLYDLAYNDLEFAASGSEIPFPKVGGALGQLAVKIGIPTTLEPGDMALGLALRDLTVGEEIWALVDPAGQLPRDPASVALDLSGTMKFLIDVFAMDGEDAPEDLPAEVTALDINELLLTVGGAVLEGSGAFTFDWSAPGPFGPGTPAPDGALSLSLTGAMGLMQTLEEIQLLPPQQAMMGRMALGAIAVPGDGPDTLVSEITVSPDGTILANGSELPF
ncbi:MAG: DUF2125 domain-containing protein [Pseudomonadota bacterium]